jgi:hypothetical protein
VALMGRKILPMLTGPDVVVDAAGSG